MPKLAFSALTLPTLHRVAHVEQNFKVQLFATIREIERSHLGRIAGLLGAVERFAIHLFEIGQDPLTGTRHTQGLEGFEGQAGRDVTIRLDTFRGVEELRQSLENLATSAILEVHGRGDRVKNT